MGNPKETYLVRGGDGTMHTVIAFSYRGALKIYLTKYKTSAGDIVSVKPRGYGDWEDYKIS